VQHIEVRYHARAIQRGLLILCCLIMLLLVSGVRGGWPPNYDLRVLDIGVIAGATDVPSCPLWAMSCPLGPAVGGKQSYVIYWIWREPRPYGSEYARPLAIIPLDP
jgi:hypothetical protein